MSFRYHFVPYSRRGAARWVTGADIDAIGRSKASLTLRASVRTKDGSERHEDHSQSFKVFGPGDVTGVDATQVVRTAPRAGTHNMEPNYLAHVEFAHPDYPWLFSPHAPDASHHLMPWIALVVLEEPERRPRVRTIPGVKNAVVQVQAAELPTLDEAWAWAHVQVLDVGTAVGDVLNHWETNRHLIVSRLICPRRLAADTQWVACVVPTYKSGVQAGLSEKPTKGAEPAWTAASGAFRLPVYYHWRFATGPAGDFETLAQKLSGAKPDQLSGVGERLVHLDPVISRLHQAGDAGSFGAKTIVVPTAIARTSEPGALSPVSNAPDVALRDATAKRLKFLVDFQERVRRAGADDVIVGPPIYGQWHAERRSIDDQIDTPEVALPEHTAWVTEINADIAQRAVAALGTRVVQRDQEDLMARAWEQLQAVADANRRARWGLVFRSSSIRLHERRIAPRATAGVLRVAAPALGRLRVDAATTVATQIRASAMPLTLVGANFARSTRFVARATARAAATPVAAPRVMNALVAPMLANALPASASPRLAGAARVAPDEIGVLLERAGVSDRIAESTGISLADHVQRLRDLPSVIRNVEQRLDVADPAPPPEEDRAGQRFERAREGAVVAQMRVRGAAFNRARNLAAAVVANEGEARPALANALQRLTATDADENIELPTDALAALAVEQRRVDVRQPFDLDVLQDGVRLKIDPVQRMEFRRFVNASGAAAAVDAVSQYAAVRSATLAQFHVEAPVAPLAVRGVSEAIAGRMAAAVAGVGDRLTSPDRRMALPSIAALDAATVQQSVVATLNPRVQYDRMLKWAIELSERGPVKPRRRSPAHEIMAAPRFVDSALERLRRVDQEWILGHADRLPPNSVSILVANARFVESFLVGANYEMARELQWRRYPTDLMGTCFARFWPLPPDAPDDIAPIATWDAKLGDNAADADRNPGQDVVIVIRGDLLRRYPNTIVSAVRGRTERQQDGLSFIADAATPPVRELFRGFLDPDITYSGLAISADKLKTIVPGDPNRWYITLTQPTDEPRFGLDDAPGAQAGPVGTLNDLSWQSLPAALVAGGMLRVNADIPGQEGWREEAGETDVRWGPASHSGQIASILLQLPFQLLLRASDYL